MGAPRADVIPQALPPTVLPLSLSTSRRGDLSPGALTHHLFRVRQPTLLIVTHMSFLSRILQVPTAFTLMVLVRPMPLHQAPSPLTPNLFPVPPDSRPLLHHFQSHLFPLLSLTLELLRLSLLGLMRLSLWLFVLVVFRRLQQAPFPLAVVPLLMSLPLHPRVGSI